MNNLNEKTGELSTSGEEPSLVNALATEEELVSEAQEEQGNQSPTNGRVEIGNHASEMAKLPQDFGGIQSSERAKERLNLMKIQN